MLSRLEMMHLVRGSALRYSRFCRCGQHRQCAERHWADTLRILFRLRSSSRYRDLGYNELGLPVSSRSCLQPHQNTCRDIPGAIIRPRRQAPNLQENLAAEARTSRKVDCARKASRGGCDRRASPWSVWSRQSARRRRNDRLPRSSRLCKRCAVLISLQPWRYWRIPTICHVWAGPTLHRTHRRLRPPAFPTVSRPRLAGTAMEISRFPCKRLPRVPGSTTTRGQQASCDIDARRVAFCGTENIGTPNLSYAAPYLACVRPCERFTSALASNRASLGAGVARYAFTVTDFHRLPSAGLPAHPSTSSPMSRVAHYKL
jgi:hypothetical protein